MEVFMLEKFNELGKMYGRLTVIERADNYKDGSVMWYCVCNCGNDKRIKVRANNLRSGHTISCGCIIIETNKKIHKNKVVSKITRSKISQSNIGQVRLLTRSELGKKFPERGKYERGSLVVRKINGIIANARKRQIEFSISKELAAELITKPCNYCGQESNLIGHKECSGIDRVDNNKGYIEGNCVSCCFYCNSYKSDRSFEDFKNHISKLYHNLWVNHESESIKRE